MTAAKFTRGLIIALTSYSAIAYAADFDPPSLEQNLKEQLAASLEALDRKINHCEESLLPTEPFKIKPDPLVERKINFKELLTALTYHANWPREVCPLAEKQQVIWALLKQYVALQNENQEPLNIIQSGLAFLMPSTSTLLNEFNYQAIPDIKRAYLDRLFEGKMLTPHTIINMEEIRNKLRPGSF